MRLVFFNTHRDLLTLMIFPFRYSLSDTSAALLDLIPPALLQELVEYQLDTLEAEWEPQHIRAAAELCEYVDLTYSPTGYRSKLAKLTNKLREQLNLASNS